MSKKNILIIIGSFLAITVLILIVYSSTLGKNTAEDRRNNNTSTNNDISQESQKRENTDKDEFQVEVLAKDLTNKDVVIDSIAQIKDVFKNSELKTSYNVEVDPCKLLDTDSVKKKLKISDDVSIFEKIRMNEQISNKEKSLALCSRKMDTKNGKEALTVKVIDFSTQSADKLADFQKLFKLVYGKSGFIVENNLIQIKKSTNISSKQAEFFIGQYYIEVVSTDGSSDNFESFIKSFYLEIKK